MNRNIGQKNHSKRVSLHSFQRMISIFLLLSMLFDRLSIPANISSLRLLQTRFTIRFSYQYLPLLLFLLKQYAYSSSGHSNLSNKQKSVLYNPFTRPKTKEFISNN